MKKRNNKSNIPRQKRMKKESRLQAAMHWIGTYEGKNIVHGYSKHFAVNKLSAAKELQLLGIKVSAEYIGQLKLAEENKHKAAMVRKLKKRREEEINYYNDWDDIILNDEGSFGEFSWLDMNEDTDTDFNQLNLETDFVDFSNEDIPF